MLPTAELRKAIIEGHVKVSYPISKGARFEEDWVSITQSPKLESTALGNRLPVTVGPLLLPLARSPRLGERFEDRDDLVDLRKLKDGYAVRPGESVFTLSAERFKWRLYGALVMSKVHNGGLHAHATFVDPNWNGPILLMLTNCSREPRLVGCGQEVARMFIFPGSPPSHIEEGSVPTQDSGATYRDVGWQEIIDNPDRFPGKIKERRTQQWGSGFRRLLAAANGTFAGVGILTLGGAAYSTGKFAIERWPHATAGHVTVTIPAKSRHGEQRVPFPNWRETYVHLQCRGGTCPPGVTLNSSIEDGPGDTKLRVTAEGPDLDVDRPIDVQWAVIPSDGVERPASP